MKQTSSSKKNENRPNSAAEMLRHKQKTISVKYCMQKELVSKVKLLQCSHELQPSIYCHYSLLNINHCNCIQIKMTPAEFDSIFPIAGSIES